MVRGKLNINGRPASLTNLKNVKLTLTTNNYIDNLPVTKTFNNLTFNNEKELSVTFQVPPNLDKIHVDLKCDVANATTKSNEKFSESHTFRVSANNNIGDKVMQLPYLRKVNGEYEVVFLGRNGEVAANKKVVVHLRHRLYHRKTHKMTTNKHGIIKLGPCDNITNIEAQNEGNSSNS